MALDFPVIVTGADPSTRLQAWIGTSEDCRNPAARQPAVGTCNPVTDLLPASGTMRVIVRGQDIANALSKPRSERFSTGSLSACGDVMFRGPISARLHFLPLRDDGSSGNPATYDILIDTQPPIISPSPASLEQNDDGSLTVVVPEPTEPDVVGVRVLCDTSVRGEDGVLFGGLALDEAITAYTCGLSTGDRGTLTRTKIVVPQGASNEVAIRVGYVDRVDNLGIMTGPFSPPPPTGDEEEGVKGGCLCGIVPERRLGMGGRGWP
jgi:hypothetical protein